MSENRIKESFDALTPSEEAKDRMFANILSALEEDASEENASTETTTVVPLPVRKRNKGLIRTLSAAACFVILVLAGVTLAPRIISHKSAGSEITATESTVSEDYEMMDGDAAVGEMHYESSPADAYSNDKSAESTPSYHIAHYASSSQIDWDSVPEADIESVAVARLVVADDTGLVCRITCTDGSLRNSVENAGLCLYQDSASELVIQADRTGSVRTWIDDIETVVPGISVRVEGDSFLLPLPWQSLEEHGFAIEDSADLSGDFFLNAQGTRWWSGSGCYGKACYGNLIL